MKILFTKKKLDRKLISEKFGDHILYDFIDVIRINPLTHDSFDLKSKSIIFTSINGVIGFFENGFVPNENFTDKNYNKIYCVGKKTKKKVREYGFGTFKVKKHAQDLLEFIVENSEDEKFLHFCGNLSLDVLKKELPLQNIWYKKIIVYETILLHPTCEEKYDAVAFFSPSGVKSFVKHNSLDQMTIFSMGNTTTKEIKKHTKKRIYTSKESNLDDLLKLIKNTIS